MAFKLIRKFIQLESSSGLILLAVTVLALIVSNSPWYEYYQMALHAPLGINYGHYFHAKPMEFWINDGLMTLFFLVVGLEIKRELLTGELNTFSKRILPGLAALGGMIAPACIYIAINWGDAVALRGWAIPTATDIAFTLGFLSMLGSRVPLALKVFLMALAILDDLGAIIIIAIFYTNHLSGWFLALSAALMSILALLNYFKVARVTIYMLVGILLWVAVLQSGVHSTIAGVLLAMTIPLSLPENMKPHSPARYLEKRLHPWVAFGILPLFAFANAGLHFSNDLALGSYTVPLGIIVALVIGKPLGVMAACWLAIKLRIAQLPEHASWPILLGIACMCGIGFTMSLFVGGLAFSQIGDPELTMKLRAGVLIGSTLSTITGFILLFLFCKRQTIGE